MNPHSEAMRGFCLKFPTHGLPSPSWPARGAEGVTGPAADAEASRCGGIRGGDKHLSPEKPDPGRSGGIRSRKLHHLSHGKHLGSA